MVITAATRRSDTRNSTSRTATSLYTSVVHTLRRVGTISASDLSASLRDYIVIDARHPDAWHAGHLPGSIPIHPDQVGAAWTDPDPRLPIVVVADDTTTAETLVARLRNRGRDAVVLEGGHFAWIAAAGCVVRSCQAHDLTHLQGA